MHICDFPCGGTSWRRGALYYFKFMKPKQSVKDSTDLDDFEFEDYDEDESEADGTGGDVSEDEDTENGESKVYNLIWYNCLVFCT